MSDVKKAILDEIEGMLSPENEWRNDIVKCRERAINSCIQIVDRHLEGMVIVKSEDRRDPIDACIEVYTTFSPNKIESEQASVRKAWRAGKVHYRDAQS